MSDKRGRSHGRMIITARGREAQRDGGPFRTGFGGNLDSLRAIFCGCTVAVALVPLLWCHPCQRTSAFGLRGQSARMLLHFGQPEIRHFQSNATSAAAAAAAAATAARSGRRAAGWVV